MKPDRAGRRAAGRLLARAVTAAAIVPGARIAAAQPKTATETRAVSGYEAIDWQGVGELTINQDGREGVVLEAEPRLLSRIRTEVRNGTLVLHFAEGSFTTEAPIRFAVSLKSLRRLTASGSGDIRIGRLTTPGLTLRLDGAGDLVIDELASDRLDLRVEGSGSVTIASGEVGEQVVEIDGSGSYHGEAMRSERCRLTISGSADASVYVRRALDIRVSGSGDVRYRGEPRVTQSIDGAGSIERINQ